jgi:hypothetical protein
MASLKSILSKVGRRPPPPPASLEPWSGELVDVDVFFAQAWAELHARQDHLARKWGLAGASFAVDQDAGLIEFERRDSAVLRAHVQIIGAWNPDTEMFSWAWDHPSVHPRLRRAAERTRWFGERHQLPEMARLQAHASEADAWRFTAVAMKLNGAAGAYRAPSDGPFVFMTFSDVALVAGDDLPQAAE